MGAGGVNLCSSLSTESVSGFADGATGADHVVYDGNH